MSALRGELFMLGGRGKSEGEGWGNSSSGGARPAIAPSAAATAAPAATPASPTSFTGAVSGCQGSVIVPESIVATLRRGVGCEGCISLWLLSGSAVGVDLGEMILVLPGVPNWLSAPTSLYPPSSAKRLCSPTGGV